MAVRNFLPSFCHVFYKLEYAADEQKFVKCSSKLGFTAENTA